MTEQTKTTTYNDIDLTNHAAIEASAGTGKTYTIENLVVKLLTLSKQELKLKKDITIDQILIVTFTEKATSELKERIRNKIIEKINDKELEKNNKERLKDSLDKFDNASIFTIHGFCMQVLRQYAFENKEAFNLEVFDDDKLYEKVLHNIMRTKWHQIYDEKLEDILEISGFSDAKSRWEQVVLDIAKKYRLPGSYLDLCGDWINPEYNKDFDLKYINNEIKEKLSNISELLGDINRENIEGNEFCKQYDKLNINGASKQSIIKKILLPLINMIDVFRQNKESNYYLCKNFIKTASYRPVDYKKRKKDDFGFLTDFIFESIDNSFKEKIHSLVFNLNFIYIFLKKINYQLSSNTIVDLKEEIIKFKREHGLLSYDDMLSLVYIALLENDMLLENLRNRYKYAFVDEFQDTDPIQWNIFKKIFFESRSNKLFIVGDPKQAIYGFRGADVFTYEEAKEYMLSKDANCYPLSTNWRSIPELIESFNIIFKEDNWFTRSKIKKAKHTDIKAPEKNIIKARVCHDKTGRAPLTFVNIDSQNKSAQAQILMAEFIAKEIRHLLNRDGSGFIFYDKDAKIERHLQADDICILVRKTKEAKIIEEALKQNKIPYSFYKKQGLYQSDEALHLKYLFAAIAYPTNEQNFKKALMTRFFNISLEDLWKYEELPATHKIKKLFEKWIILSSKRKWPELFRSILVDTGVIYRDAEEVDGERRITNYQHILQNLETEAYAKNFDFTEIFENLNNYINNSVNIEENSQLHRIETEKPKVQVMTIHACKGLDFPIVFLAGGFTKDRAENYRKYHIKDQDGKQKTVYDLIKNSSGNNEEKYKEEIQYEKERLFYVALTRAIYKLYIPQFSPDDRRGGIGPISDFIFNALSKTLDESNNVKCIGKIDVNELQKAQNKSNEIADTKEFWLEDLKSQLHIPEPLLPEDKISFDARAIELYSFSKLKVRIEREYLPKQDSINISYETDYLEKSDDDIEKQIPVHHEESIILPPGSLTGSMLHEILQEIPFEKVAKSNNYLRLLDDDEIQKLLEDKMEKYYSLEFFLKNNFFIKKQGLIQEAAKIVWNTLNTPLPIEGGKKIILSEILQEDRIHELEFYYPFKKLENINFKLLNVLEIDYSDENFVNGFIDLVFRIHGKYYFLDWKSNILKNGYRRENIEENMNDSKYKLQYKIYKIAVIEWLKKVFNEKFDYKKHFGGIYYIYMRGRNFENPDYGFVFYPPLP